MGELQYFDLKIAYQYSRPSDYHQGGMPYLNAMHDHCRHNHNAFTRFSAASQSPSKIANGDVDTCKKHSIKNTRLR